MKNFLLLSTPKAIIDHSFLGGHVSSNILFERSSDAQRTNAAGLLENVASGKPRFDYDPITNKASGLLVEGEATNLLLQSEDYTNSAWNKVRTTTSACDILSPNGVDTMLEVISTGSFGGIRQDVSIDQGSTYTWSAYVKYKDFQYCYFVSSTNSSDACVYDLINGVTDGGTDGTINHIGDGIYRITFTNNALSSADTFQLNVGEYTGDNYSGYGVYVWGAQVEKGVIASSYIQTQDEIEIRESDQLSFTVPNGVSALRYTFDDKSTQDVDASEGLYNVPTTLNRKHIVRIESI